MPVPTSIDDLSTTASSNSPAGSESPTDGDNYIRTYGSFIAILRDKLDGTSDTGVVQNATFSGTMAGAASWSGLQTFASVAGATNGTTYAPTITAVTNVTSATADGSFKYIRINNIVMVSGSINVTPTSAALIVVGISLPVASAFTLTSHLNGSGADSSGGIDGNGAALLFADVPNDRASLQAYPASTSARSYGITFMYQII